MRGILSAVSILAVTAGTALAGGIDRSNQGIGILFETGRLVELSLGQVSPSVSGTDVPLFGGRETGNVADDFGQVGLSFKADINDKLSYAVIFDQPFGADVNYGVSSIALGGTTAYAKTGAITGLLRYKFNENFSVHGGVRGQRAFGNIDLRGAAYGPLNGYSVSLDDDISFGYVVGVAYERPDIALRVALTYNSKITHEFDTAETINGVTYAVPPFGATGFSTTNVSTPQSVNLDFQTGIAKDTLLFGNVRWVDWEQFQINPESLGLPPPFGAASGLIEIENTTTYTLGIGRRFNDTWSGSFSVTYEDDIDPLISPLGPTDGRLGFTLAAIYTKGPVRVTTGVNYTLLGDAIAETGTPDTARATFEDNDSYGFGVRVAYRF